MLFENTPNVKLRKDKEGRVRNIHHIQEPFLLPKSRKISSPQVLASTYLKEIIPYLEIEPVSLENVDVSPLETFNIDLGNELRLVNEKRIMANTTLEYVQTLFGIPLWCSGLTVLVQHDPLRISGAMSTLKYDVHIENVQKKEANGIGNNFDPITEKVLSELIKNPNDSKTISYGPLKINKQCQIIYRYNQEQRLESHSDHIEESEDLVEEFLVESVHKSIKDGAYYIIHEVHFSLPKLKGKGEDNWRIYIEPQTKSVLYLRNLVANADASGYVYKIDPITKSGSVNINGFSTATNLNSYQELVTLKGLDPPGDKLKGEFVYVTNITSPDPSTPEEKSANFKYDVKSDAFSAVCAYYHCDKLFRTMQDMGFDLSVYFDGTTFPVDVDHRGYRGLVNAQSLGNTLGNGSRGFRFGLLQKNSKVGLVVDWRIVLHEFGHTILWDHVHTHALGFAHSCGDSLAAILCDPGSKAPDRFETYPFVPTVSRRHDRTVEKEWGWGGPLDTGGYRSEQILSTTLFRAYRSCGGDSDKLVVQEFAARYMSFLIFSAVGSLTPSTNPEEPEDFAFALQNADISTVNFENNPGGAFHKVIRWAFEKQGAFQGTPPEVDVYVDDGRNGEYEFQPNFGNAADLWNRLQSDGDVVHEQPVIGVPNYMYVRVKNRGTQIANNVIVKAFHTISTVDLVWPDSWQTITPPKHTETSISSGGSAIVGPFVWTPTIEGEECLLAVVEADGDLSNTNNISGSQSIPNLRLVPFDNNIVQRSVVPVSEGSEQGALVSSSEERKFQFKNPYSYQGRGTLEAQLPKIFVEKGWKVKFSNLDGDHFSLDANEEKEVIFTLEAGENFSQEELNTLQDFSIHAFLNGFPIGGMTYSIGTSIGTNIEIPEKETSNDKTNDSEKIENLVNQLKANMTDIDIKEILVKEILGKKITIEIELNDEL